MSGETELKASMTREDAKAIIEDRYDVPIRYIERIEPHTGYRRLAEAFIDHMMQHGRATPPGVEMVPEGTIAALETARHDLTTVHGLTATDEENAYRDALDAGLDHQSAKKCEDESTWKIDNSATLAKIDAILTAHRATQKGGENGSG